MNKSKPSIVLVPSPGLGHLIPFLELAKVLVAHHNFHATVVVVFSSNTSAAQYSQISQIIQRATTPKLFDIIELTSPAFVNPSVDAVMTTLVPIMLAVQSSLRAAFSAMEQKPTAMIVDILGTAALTVAEEFNMLKYVRFPCARVASLILYMPILDKQVQGEYTEPVEIPGCRPYPPEDLGLAFVNRKDSEYESFVRTGYDIGAMADGILVQTWENLEPTSLNAMREHLDWKQIVKVPIYTFGPIIRPTERLGSRSSDNDKLLDWLDLQPKGSVIYISFGTGGLLSADQITEMAWGLELSSQRFIWVVKTPTPIAGNENEKGDVSDYLPEGFTERTLDKGVVVTTWAPQEKILAHSSVGGFLSHCGWNSVQESLLNGVAIITWPLYGEQAMNATMLVEDLKVAIRLKGGSPRVVGREEIEAAVRKMVEMEHGDAVRARARELKKSGEIAMSQGGSSFSALSQLAKLCDINTQRQKN